MPFLVQEVLETEVGLIHLMAGVGGCLLVGPCGGIGGAVEGFEAGEEGGGADVEGGEGVWVERGDCGICEVAEGAEDVVGGGWG